MGIIIRQSLKASTVRYAAVFFAAIATLFVYPLHTEAKGEVDALFAFATLFAPFAVFGGNALIIRFFPSYNQSWQRENGLMWFIIFYEIVALCIFTIFYFLFLESLVDFLARYMPNSNFILKYRYIIIILVWILVGIGFLMNYTSNYKRIVIPILLNQLIPKVVLPILILLVYLNRISLENMIYGYISYFILIACGLCLYFFYLKGWHFRPHFGVFKSINIREFFPYAFYGMLGGIGFVIAFQIDVIMVRMFTNASDTGVFTISSFIANAIQIPNQSILAIAAPIISENLNENRIIEVESLYKKSSLVLLIVGIIIFTCAWSGIHDLFRITGRYELLLPGVYVVLWAGLAKLWNMATSINGQIISYSKHFRFNFYVVALLAVMNVILNLKLIPKYGIVGAAMATFISLSIFNLIKLIYVWIKFKIQPFTKESIYVIALGLLAYAVVWLIPDSGYPIINILIKSTVIILIIGFPVIHFRFSEDLNRTLGHMVNRIKRMTK